MLHSVKRRRRRKRRKRRKRKKSLLSIQPYQDEWLQATLERELDW